MRGIKKNKFIEYAMIVAGTVLMAFAIDVFYSPNQLVTGGVTGMAIIIKNLSQSWFGFDVPIWVTNIAFNVPLFLLALKINGKAFLGKTLLATASLTVALMFTSRLPAFSGDMIICSLFGGVITGTGLGLVFRCFATTGGSDLAASLIHRSFRYLNVSSILFALDTAVIALGMFVFGIEKAMYAIIVVFVCSKVIDAILEGLSFAKAAFIISERSAEISDKVIKDLNRGATSLTGRGMYTGSDKNVLLCVVSQKEVVALKDIVSSLDKNAFLIMADVREVLGEGFKEF